MTIQCWEPAQLGLHWLIKLHWGIKHRRTMGSTRWLSCHCTMFSAKTSEVLSKLKLRGTGTATYYHSITDSKTLVEHAGKVSGWTGSHGIPSFGRLRPFIDLLASDTLGFFLIDIKCVGVMPGDCISIKYANILFNILFLRSAGWPVEML